MIRNTVALGWLLVVWLVLWRDVSVANVASGAVLGAALLVLFPLPPSHQRLQFRPVALLRFSAAFAWSVASANLIVAWEVMTPHNRISEGVVAVPLATRDPIIITIVSHAIILAPGTMVIDIDRGPSTVLFVHVLHLRSADGVRREVQALERLASTAFGARSSDEARRHTDDRRPGHPQPGLARPGRRPGRGQGGPHRVAARQGPGSGQLQRHRHRSRGRRRRDDPGPHLPRPPRGRHDAGFHRQPDGRPLHREAGARA